MLKVLLIPGPFPTICRFVCSSLSPFQRDQNLQLQPGILTLGSRWLCYGVWGNWDNFLARAAEKQQNTR